MVSLIKKFKLVQVYLISNKNQINQTNQINSQIKIYNEKNLEKPK